MANRKKEAPRQPKFGSKDDRHSTWVDLGTYDVTVPEGMKPGDTFDAPFAEQDIHKDITRQMFLDVLDTAIHSVLVTGEDAAQLRIQPPNGDSQLLKIPPYNMLFFHGRLSHAGVGYAMRHSRLHCYIGDRRVERVLTPEFLNQSDLVDRNASLSWFDNNE